MATRTVSTKLAIEGESEYRASLSRINTELKTLQSALKLTESQYQTNANSMQALQEKHDALTKVQEAQRKKVEELRNALNNAKSAEENYARKKEELKAKIDANNKALEKLKATTGDTTKEEAKLTEENAKLQKELTEVDAKLTAAEKGTNAWQTQLNNAEIQLNNLDAELAKNDKYLDEAKSSADGCATSIDEFGNEVDETAGSVQSLSELLASEQLQKFGQTIASVLADCVQASMDFEAQMAAVKRTTGMSDNEIAALGEHFKDLATQMPITTEELASIAANAGQLGVAKENVESFTTIMAQLATTTDLTAENASTMLAQFAAITGMDPSDYDKLGSTVAALGDNSATTASKIVDMAQGIAGAGSQAGMSEADILAISAAVGSIGIEAGAGSTAMSTLIQEIDKSTKTGGQKLDTFAKTAGMSSQEFIAAWKTDPAAAMATFISGLNDVERNGKSTIEVLEDLGITNVRQKRALIGLAEAGGLLNNSLKTGKTAWEENTALAEKSEIMYVTLQAKTTELESASNNLKIAIGDSLSPALGSLAETGTTVLNAVTKFVEDHPQLTEALTLTAAGIAGITTAFAAFKAAQKVNEILHLTEPIEKLAASAKLAGGGLTGLGSALGALLIPAASVATALMSVAVLVDRIGEMKDVGFLGEGHTLEEYAANVDNYKAKVAELEEEYNNLATYGGDLTMAQDALTMAQLGLTHATEEYTAAQEAANQAQIEAVGTTEEQAEAIEYQQALNEAMAGSIAELASSYREAYDACRESLDGQIKLFDDYAKSIAEDTDTAREMLDKWATQTINLKEYTENLKKAAEYGLDQGLIKSLSDGSTESAGYLATIIGEIESCANGTGTLGTSADAAVKQFNDAFKMTSDAKDELAATMTAINTNLETSLAEMEATASEIGFEGFWEAVDAAFADVGVKFDEIGANIGTGMKSGIDGKKGDVESAASDMAQGATDTAMSTLGEKSPSKVFKEIGENLDQGLIEGIDGKATSVVASVQKMGNQLNNNMRTIGRTAQESFVSSFQQIESRTRSILYQLSSGVINATAGLPGQMYSIGTQISQGMASGILSSSGSVYAAINSVVSTAMSTARRAAAVRSPSRITKEIFEYVGEGMAVGIEGKKERVATATQDVVKNALSLDISGVEKAAQLLRTSAPDMSSLLWPSVMSPGLAGDNADYSVTVNVENMEVRSDSDIEQLSKALAQKVRLEQRRRGRV